MWPSMPAGIYAAGLTGAMKSFPVSVNISRIDVYNMDLVKRLQDLMHKYDLPLHLLELEFTETAYTQDSNQMVQMANALKSCGF
jgi:EAL domain-containing protein (putative c-di-GMP-specific phosphodiesterase class I)